jgi:PAS domain S-box-containing protein
MSVGADAGGVLPGGGDPSQVRLRAGVSQMRLGDIEAGFRITAELMADYAYVVQADEQGELQLAWSSSSYATLCGHPGADLRAGWTPTWLTEPAQRSAVTAAWHAAQAGHRQSVEFCLRRQDDSTRWVEETIAPMGDLGEGPTRRLFVVGTLLTARRSRAQGVDLLGDAAAQSAEGMALLDLEERVVWVNHAYAALHGYAIEELLGKHVSIFHPPAHLPRLQQTLAQMRRTGRFMGDVEHLRKDGTTFTGYMRNTLIRDPAGEPLALLGTLSDVSEMKQAEQALRESERAYRLLAEHASDVIMRCSAEGEFLYVSPASEAVLGIKAEDLIGTQARDGVHPDDRERHREAFASLGSSTDCTTLEYRRLRADGSYVWLQTKSRAVLDPDSGALREVVCVVRDVSERRQMEMALRRSEHQYRSFMQKLEGIAFRGRLDFSFVFCHGQVEEITGYPAAEFTGSGRKWIDLIHPEDRPPQLSASRRAGEGEKVVHNQEYRIIRQDGSVRWVHEQSHVVQVEQEVLAEGIIYDVTARREAQDELARAHTDLEQRVQERTSALQAANVALRKEIAGRQRVEQELRENEDRFRTIAEALPMPLLIVRSRDNVVVYANSRLGEAFGRTPERMLGRKGTDLWADPAEWDALGTALDEQGRLSSYEIQGRRADGGAFWVVASAEHITFQGEPSILAVLYDVTERKRTEDALRANEEKYRALVEATRTGYLILDTAGRVIDANQEFVRITGAPRLGEVFDRPLEHWAAEYDRPRLAAALASCKAEGGIDNLSIDCVDELGRTTPVEITGQLVHLEEGERILALCRDIAERRRAELALRESEERFRQLCNSAPIGIFLTDSQGMCTYVNRALETISGLPADGAYGDGWMRLLAPDAREQVRPLVERAAEHMVSFQHEFPIVTTEGDRRWIAVRTAVLRLEDGTITGQVGTVQDVSERRQAEEALRKSEARFRAITECSQQVAALIDRDGLVRYVSPSVTPLLGFEQGEVVGRSVWDFSPPQDADRLRSLMDSAIEQQGATIAFRPLRGKRSDGGLFHFEGHITNLLHVPDVEGLLIMGRNVTDSMEAEAALTESEARYRSVAESVSAAVFVYRGERLLYANPAAECITGYSAAELSNLTWQQLLDDADPTALPCCNPAELEGATGEPCQCELRLVRKDGSTRWVDFAVAPIEYGSEIVRLGTAFDITDRKEAEEALRAGEERLDLALHGADLATWDWHITSGATAWSARFAQMLGYEPAELVPTFDTWKAIVHPEDRPRVLARLEQHLRQKAEAFEAEYRVRTKSDEWKWVLSRGRVVERATDGAALRASGTVLDIDDRKRAEEILQRAKEAAEAASASKTEFLAKMSHEIRTPITALLAAAEFLANNRSLADEVRSTVNVVVRNGQHLLALINDLLDAAQFDSGRLSVRPEWVNLPELIQDVQAVTAVLHDDPSVAYRIVCASPLPRQVHTDGTRLKQAMINLVSNALRHTREGSVEVRISAERSGPEPRLTIVVEDTGPGIAPEDQQRVFELFEQLDVPRSTSTMGVGVGLPLARWIAEHLGGSLEVESTVGVGSRFTLRVATGDTESQEWVAPAVVTVSGRPDPRVQGGDRLVRLSGRVLIAEDFEDTRVLLGKVLRDAGVEVTAVEDGEQAVEAGLGGPFDLILMDIRMPRMDGLAATRALRAGGCLVPIIALTASKLEEDDHWLDEFGFDDFWQKPLMIDELLDRASAYLHVVEEWATEEPVREVRVGDPAPPPAGRSARGSWLDNPRLAEAVAEYGRAMPGRIQAVADFISIGDRTAALELLHQITGSAGIHGFHAVSRAAGDLLTGMRKNDWPLDDARVPHSMEQLHSLAAEAAAQHPELTGS